MDVSLAQEVAGVELGDKRLTDRLAVIVDRSGSHPNLNIPAAMRGRSELEAAYRFFANEKVTPDAILSTHYAKTKQRIAEHSVSLLVQDTTEVDLTPEEKEKKRNATPIGEKESIRLCDNPKRIVRQSQCRAFR